MSEFYDDNEEQSITGIQKDTLQLAGQLESLKLFRNNLEESKEAYDWQKQLNKGKTDDMLGYANNNAIKVLSNCLQSYCGDKIFPYSIGYNTSVDADAAYEMLFERIDDISQKVVAEYMEEE